MAQEVTIKVVATTKEAEENLKRLNSTLNEQNEILVDLERELYKVEEAQKNTSKVNLAAQRKLTEQANHLKSAIKDQRISLKELNSERRITKTALDDLSDSSLNQSAIIQGIDKVTGGYATKLKKLYLGLVEGAKGVKTFILGLNGIKKAVIATGIGALVVALASIIAYWDDIKGLVSGVSSEQEKLLADTKATAAASKNILDATSASENSLKIQGKTEREIRDLKIQQTKEVISATEAVLEQQIQQAIAQEAAMQRNKDIAQNVIRFLSMPLTAILATVDMMTAAISKIPGIDIATNLEESFSGGLANMLFDPEETKKEGEATIAETEKQLAELRNRRDGFKLQNQADANKAAEEAKALELKKAQELADLKNEIRDAEANSIAEQRIKELEDLQLHYDALILKAQENQIATDELEKSKKESLLQLQADFNQQDLDAAQKLADDKKAIDDKAKADKKKNDDADIALAKKAADAKIASLNGYASAISGISSLLGKETEAAKGVAVASSLINTYAAITGQLKAFAGVPVPGYAIAQAIVTGIAGFAAVKDIISTKVPESSGGGYAAATPSLSGISSAPAAITAPSAPPSFNVVGASDSSQLAGVIANQSQQPIQAYVVSNDVTTAQSLDRNIIESVGI
jgi:hypothetical protein